MGKKEKGGLKSSIGRRKWLGYKKMDWRESLALSTHIPRQPKGRRKAAERENATTLYSTGERE